MRTLFTLPFLLLALPAFAADFDIGLSYGQSRDFWKTVHDVQNQTGNIGGINNAVAGRYGRPDILYSALEASYSYPHEMFDWDFLGRTSIGTRAEALAGGEISNPISPEIQAYADSVGIFSIGFRSALNPLRRSYIETRLLGGIGPEKRLYAQGAEFIDAIPVRSGTLILGGAEIVFLDRAPTGDDFWVTTDVMLRGLYFHSSTPTPRSRPFEDREFITWHWRLQNEWLKETGTFLSDQTRFGILTTFGQTPYPFLNLPYTWDYQQKMQFWPGFGSVSGIGGIIRFLTPSAVPNFAFYGGYFGRAFGGGIDLQFGSVLLNGSTYGIENNLTPAREHTRLWNLSLGIAL